MTFLAFRGVQNKELIQSLLGGALEALQGGRGGWDKLLCTWDV